MLRIPLLLLLVSQAPADSPELKKELARHQGVWATESSRRDGRDADAAITKSITRTVAGDHVVWRRDGKSFSGSTIVLDPTADPKRIDVVLDGDPAGEKRVLGIYKLEDDRLTICTSDRGRPRPTDFKAERGTRCTLMIFSREKREKSEP